jgi:hypothetical protein
MSTFSQTFPVSPCLGLAGGSGRRGCFSPRGGVTAPGFNIEDQGDVSEFARAAKNIFKIQHVAILSSSLFTVDNLNFLNSTNMLACVIVKWPPNGIKPSSFNMGEKNIWNPEGTGYALMNLGFPIFVVRNETAIRRLKSSSTWNRKNCPSGVGSAEVIFVDAYGGGLNLDVRLCEQFNSALNGIERCRAVSGMSVWATAFHQQSKGGGIGIGAEKIVVATGMDSTSLFFSDNAPGGNQGTSGYVAVIAAIEALSKLERAKKEMIRREIVIGLFDGEVEGQSGSNSFAEASSSGCPSSSIIPSDPTFHRKACNTSSQAMKKKWGNSVPGGYIAPLEMFDLSNDISYLVAVDQVGRTKDGDAIVYAFGSDPADPVLTALQTSQVRGGSGSRVQTGKPPANAPHLLPPSPADAFLRRKLVRGEAMVYAGYESTISNKYYHSMFDDIHNVDRDDIAAFATTLSRTLFLLATADDLSSPLSLQSASEKIPGTLQADKEFVNSLVNCTLQSWDCLLTREYSVSKGQPYDSEVVSKFVGFSGYNQLAREILSRLTYSSDFESLKDCPPDLADCPDCVHGKCLPNSTAWFWTSSSTDAASPMRPFYDSTAYELSIFRKDLVGFEWSVLVAAIFTMGVSIIFGKLFRKHKIKIF